MTGPVRREPDVYVAVDRGRGLALVAGRAAYEAVEAFTRLGGPYAGFEPIYSRSGRGWVVPIRYAADIAARCQHRRELCVVYDRKGARS